MDVRRRLNRRQGTTNRNNNNDTGRFATVSTRKSVNVNRISAKSIDRRSNDDKKPKFDSNRLGFNKGNKDSKDLRQVLLDKKEEEERKKRFAANLQSRLGLQSRAAREEIKKQQEQAKKPPQNKTIAKNTNNNVSPIKKNNAPQTKLVNKLRSVKDVETERENHKSDKRVIYKQTISQSRDQLINKRRNFSSDVNISNQQSQPARVISKYLSPLRSGIAHESFNVHPRASPIGRLSDPYHSYPNRIPVVRETIPVTNVIRDIPRETAYVHEPSVSAQGHSVLINNLNPMISKADIEELFGDIGPIASIQAINPNTQLVTYFTRYDAEKARQVYHNRKLDDRPIYCTVVPDPSTSNNINTSMLSSRQSISVGRLYSDEVPSQRAINYI